MHEPSEGESRDANGDVVSAGELTTRYVCGGVLGVVVALLLRFGFSIDSAAACIAVVVISVCVCGFLAAHYGDRFWQTLIYVVFGRWW